MAVNGVLRAGETGYLRGEKYPLRIDGWLYADSFGYLRGLGRIAADAVSFPAQIAGLRYFLGTVRELCLVALGDAPTGDQWRVRKGGTDYAVYLVATSDPNASQVRVQTSEGLKAARLKT